MAQRNVTAPGAMSNVGTLGLLVGTIKLTSRTLNGLADGFAEIAVHAARARQQIAAKGSVFLNIREQCQATVMSAMGRKRSRAAAPTPLPDRQHRVDKRPAGDASESGENKNED